VVEMGGNGLAETVFSGAQKIVNVFEQEGRENAARCVFEGWCGIRWDEGPLRAAEWEGSLLGSANTNVEADVEVDVTGFDGLDSGFLV
jgi:hypothetical protein